MHQLQQLVSAIRAYQRRTGESLQSIAARAGVPKRSLSSIMQGHKPSLVRAAEVCKALGLELHIGPPRRIRPHDGEEAPAILISDVQRLTWDLVHLVANAGGDPIPDDLWPLLVARRGETVPLSVDGIAPIDRPVDVGELEATADGLATKLEEAPVRSVWFGHGRLRERGIDRSQSIVLRMPDRSMEPTLHAGCRVLVDRSRRRLVEQGIFMVRTGDRLNVWRAIQGDGGNWEARSDHPDLPTILWPADAETIGQVLWTDRFLG